MPQIYPHITTVYIVLFCGAGGETVGVENSEVDDKKCSIVAAAVNHDENAINSHEANHPHTRHFIEDIRTLDLTELIAIVNQYRVTYPNARIVLQASLECTHFSKAKGGESRDADSRSLAEHLFRYIEVIKPDYIEIENVEEFMTWGPLVVKTKSTPEGYQYCPCNVKKIKADKTTGAKSHTTLEPVWIPDPLRKGEFYRNWATNVKNHGYHFDYRILNAADFGAFTSRKRYFGTFALHGLPIIFPEPTHARIPTLKLEKWRPVKECLDLSDEGLSIFDRKIPICENTFERITAGVIRFVAGGKENFLIKWNSMNEGRYQAPGIDEPCPVVSTQNRLGIAKIKFIQQRNSGNPESKLVDIDGPARTITSTGGNQDLVQAKFISAYYGNGDNISSIDSPSPTVTTKDRLALVKPEFLINYYSGGGQHSDIETPCPAILQQPKQRLVSLNFIDQNFGKSNPVSADQPLGALTTKDKYSIVNCKQPWLMDTNFNNVGSSINQPSRVITANHKYQYLLNPPFNCEGASIDNPCFTLIARMDKKPPYLVSTETGQLAIQIYETDTPKVKRLKQIMAIYGIIDIKMRMLKIPELKPIMGFPRKYILKGTQTEQKKYIGNAVETNIAKRKCEALNSGLKEFRQKVA